MAPAHVHHAGHAQLARHHRAVGQHAAHLRHRAGAGGEQGAEGGVEHGRHQDLAGSEARRRPGAEEPHGPAARAWAHPDAARATSTGARPRASRGALAPALRAQVDLPRRLERALVRVSPPPPREAPAGDGGSPCARPAGARATRGRRRRRPAREEPARDEARAAARASRRPWPATATVSDFVCSRSRTPSCARRHRPATAGRGGGREAREQRLLLGAPQPGLGLRSSARAPGSSGERAGGPSAPGTDRPPRPATRARPRTGRGGRSAPGSLELAAQFRRARRRAALRAPTARRPRSQAARPRGRRAAPASASRARVGAALATSSRPAVSRPPGAAGPRAKASSSRAGGPAPRRTRPRRGCGPPPPAGRPRPRSPGRSSSRSVGGAAAIVSARGQAGHEALGLGRPRRALQRPRAAGAGRRRRAGGENEGLRPASGRGPAAQDQALRVLGGDAGQARGHVEGEGQVQVEALAMEHDHGRRVPGQQARPRPARSGSRARGRRRRWRRSGA